MRRVEDFDLGPIEGALAALLTKSPAPQMRMACLRTAMNYVQGARARISGAYLIMFDVGRTWYSPDPLLMEELVLKVYPDDRSRTLEQIVSEDLPGLAKLHGCRAVVVGDTQIGYMRPRYEAAGYVPTGTELIKFVR